MKPQFFIIGNPRSGTSLLRLMLNAHPHITVPPECGFTIWLKDKYMQSDFTDYNIVNEFVNELNTCRKFETWTFDLKSFREYIINAECSNYQEIISSVYEHYAAIKNKSIYIWGDKNNFYLKHINDIHSIFPHCRFIHIVRDGRDVACSYLKLPSLDSKSIYAPKLPSTITEIALEWESNISLISKQLDEIEAMQVIEIRYEDLVKQPVETLQKAASFIGVDYDCNMLNYYLNLNDHEPAEFITWKQKTLEPPSASEVGKFNIILTQEDVNAFNSIASYSLKKYGYNLSA
ncbi:MAG: sulfotransferase [Treponema sp.]|nr:sulfotransferase [Treponema sp.]